MPSRNSDSIRRLLLSARSVAYAEEHKTRSSNLCDLRNDLRSLKSSIFGSWLNVLLVFLPIGIVSFKLEWSPIITFFTNFLAMIPIASILGDSTECLAEHLGDTIGGLINATFGNAVEVVIMVFALLAAKKADETEQETLLTVVQTSLIGSIFSNSLLVLGCCFVANGMQRQECTFNLVAAESNVELLLLAAVVMLLPGPYAHQVGTSTADSLFVSRSAAIILLLLYICLLVFVLYSHSTVIQTQQDPKPIEQEQAQKDLKRALLDEDFEQHDSDEYDIQHAEIADSRSVEVGVGAVADLEMDEQDEQDEQELSLIGSVVVLLLTTILVAVLSELLVDSIQPMADALNMGAAFIGIILLPIIGNAVEHMTAVRMALEDKMDIALSIAIGSATQVAMFVVSLAILIAWCMDLDLDLAFNPFEVNLFLFSSIIIFALISDGKSNWLEGAMLLGLYLLIAIAVWPQEYSQ